MKEPSDSYRPTSEMLVTKLKSQGFFDKIRKRCLENVENNSDYIYMKHNFVDHIVSQFLSSQYSAGNKLELRDQLRRRLQGDASFQHSLRQMSDLLLATQASPESLAPSINQITCEALNVDYHEWLKMSQKKHTPQPRIFSGSTSPVKHTENPIPLLPNPSSISTNREPLLPTSSTFHLENQQSLPDENDVEMEVDDVGDEMEVESTDSNVDASSSQPQRPSKYLPTNTFVSEDVPHSNISLIVSPHDSKPITASSAVMKNSSSFSRKISTAAAAGWAASVPREQLDAVSDNETIGGYSPLRRRMSLTGQSAKHSSPPMRSSNNPSLERNPSPLTERTLLPPLPTLHRDRFQYYEGDDARRRDSNYSRGGSHRYIRDYQYYNKRQHRDHRSDRYLDSGRYGRGDFSQSNQDLDRCNYASQNHNNNGGRSGHDRCNRNTSPVESRSYSRDSLSRSQSPSLCRRQRQASPYSTHTPDTHYSNPYRNRRADALRGRRDSPHSRDYEQHKRERERHSSHFRGSGGSHRSPARVRPYRRHASSDSSSSLSFSHRSNISTPLTSSRLSGRPF
ncbi:hypothetical protein EmuJ_000438700 [Echinococcus multilocularis]|uniref:BOD1/SHG1 domain-containing protein n=1 Tax=Echinococcus multilocularis TaxID=6211 RepID=A0A068XY47_ECHMU|nr:hypothetical protein EmuJ_000438700 [Echinococcus multilocularis]